MELVAFRSRREAFNSSGLAMPAPIEMTTVADARNGHARDRRGRGAMRKLIEGIVSFRKQVLPKCARRFRRLATRQTPAVLFITCSDSRMVPTLVTSTHPGDLFVVRNVGNLVPPARDSAGPTACSSEASALEYALLVLKVADIIVCGHSECGAMKAVVAHGEEPDMPNLRKWLAHAEPAARHFSRGASFDAMSKPHDRVSRLNVLLQLEHLASYDMVRVRIAGGALRLHGWWFDIGSGSMYAYDDARGRFDLVDRRIVGSLLKVAP